MKKFIASFWRIFKKTPIGKLIRFLAPQWLVNLLEHLPIAILANIVYGFPSHKIKVIGVTGTDGKTTTTNMVYKILTDAGKKVSMVSTINAKIGNKVLDTGFHVTSPHPFDVQSFIRDAVRVNDEYIVLEVTSHSLDQHRFWGVKFQQAVITNITPEHLDYHKTMENYRAAKAKILKGTKFAILNRDDKNFDYLKKKASGKIISFGLENKAEVNAFNFPLRLKLPGKYNLSNALAAAAVAKSLGVDKLTIKQSLESFESLEGRMEEIKNTKGLRIVVDFAHTPNALEQALRTLRAGKKGKLISVFGCAAERDITKRPKMGEISAHFADITVLTSEDPRNEDPNKIIEEIALGSKKRKVVEGKDLFKEPDRYQAIKLAISMAKRGDIIGIFGKGHEKSMNIRGVEKPWSDKDAVIQVLSSKY